MPYCICHSRKAMKLSLIKKSHCSIFPLLFYIMFAWQKMKDFLMATSTVKNYQTVILIILYDMFWSGNSRLVCQRKVSFLPAKFIQNVRGKCYSNSSLVFFLLHSKTVLTILEFKYQLGLIYWKNKIVCLKNTFPFTAILSWRIKMFY